MSHHSSDSEDDDDDDNDPIDVVGGADDSDDEPEDCTMKRRESTDHLIEDGSSGELNRNSLRPNPFSIESLLYNNT